MIYYDKLNSTQEEAKKYAEKHIDNGTIILTNNQTNGIGTHGRTWISEPRKNITFTLILYPKCKVDKMDSLTLDIGKCIIDTIYDEYKYKLELKSPNDIIHNGKKLGGILTQIVSSRRKN